MVATISIFTGDSSQKTVAEVGDVGGPRFAAHEGREHQHQLARRRTDLPKAPLEKIGYNILMSGTVREAGSKAGGHFLREILTNR